MSDFRKIRNAAFRRWSYISLVICLLHIGWSWSFHKKESATETKNISATIKTAQAGPQQEIITSEGVGYRKPAAAEQKEIKSIPLEITRSDDASTYVTRSISVIDQTEIKNSTARYVPELLRSKAGIVVTDQSGNPKGMTVDIRGFGDTANRNVLVLVDGRRTNPIDISGPDWASIPLAIVERIEIIRGPSAVLYGDNAAGGVINIVTKKVVMGIYAKAESEIGLHQYKRNGATVSAANDWARGLFHYENNQDGGWRNNTDYWANDWFGKLGVGPFYGAGLDLTAGHHRDRSGLPGHLFMTDIERIGRTGSTTPDDHAWSQETFFTANPSWKFELGENGFELSGFNTFRRRLSKADYVSRSANTVNNIDSYEFQPKASWTRALTGWLTSKMTTGIDFLSGKNDIKNVDPWSLTLATVNKKSLGVYVLENFTVWNKLLLNLGFRGAWAKYRFSQSGDTNNLDTASERNAAFDFGIGFKYHERSLVYFDISRSFRMPATDEFYSTWTGLNPGLKQQQEMSYEFGIRDNMLKPLEIGMNVFLADIKDEIYVNPVTLANNNYSSPTRRYGFEMESSLRLFEKRWYNIKPFYNLTLQKPYFKGGTYNNKIIPGVPLFKFATGFVVEPVKGLTFAAELNRVGSEFAINNQSNNLPKIKSYTTVDMKAQYHWRWATAWISLTNLFNAKYSEYGISNWAGTAVAYYPAQGRNLVSGFSLEY